jgi:ABC-type enterochelin transport system substrate-binding protein
MKHIGQKHTEFLNAIFDNVDECLQTTSQKISDKDIIPIISADSSISYYGPEKQTAVVYRDFLANCAAFVKKLLKPVK